MVQIQSFGYNLYISNVYRTVWMESWVTLSNLYLYMLIELCLRLLFHFHIHFYWRLCFYFWFQRCIGYVRFLFFYKRLANIWNSRI